MDLRARTGTSHLTLARNTDTDETGNETDSRVNYFSTASIPSPLSTAKQLQFKEPTTLLLDWQPKQEHLAAWHPPLLLEARPLV